MLGHIPFYNETLRRLVATFGTLFNDIQIQKRAAGDTASATVLETVNVPLSYGPKEKWLARLQADPGINRPVAITLPRMSFEMVSMQYDGSRKLRSTGKRVANTAYVYNPVPYNIAMNLYVMTKGTDDSNQILEQILPFFAPEFTNRIMIVDQIGEKVNVPIVLKAVNSQDTYDGTFLERRALIWTLQFEILATLFGPVITSNNIIKIINVNTYTDLPEANTPIAELTTIKPGLTANGQPTTDPTQSIDPQQINVDDDWAYITTIQDF